MGRKQCLKELTIKNNFMFGAVMMDEENCKGFLERVLEIPIERVEVSKEKSIVYHPEYKGVRLDVYAKDENKTRYNVEMLLTGEDYVELPNTYVIFICDFDPFGEGKYRYTFRAKCEESEEVDLGDGRLLLFLNTQGKNESEVPKKLVTFLKYVKEDLEGSEKDFHDPYVERLQRCVREIKGNRGMEERFMIFEEMLRDERTAGREEGRIENAKETLFLLLQNFGAVSKELSVKIQTQQDSEVLKQWTQIAFQSKSLEEFNEKISL